MEFSVQKLSESKTELKIELLKEEFDNFLEKAILNLGKDFEIDGFRKGKAPKEIIKEKIGDFKILEEAANLAINESYFKAINQLEEKIEIISQPKIEILKMAVGNPFIFKAIIETLPEIKVPDYKKIASQIKKKEIIVEEKEIGEAINWIQRSRAKLTLKKEPAQFGDFVEIEFQSPQIEGGQNKKDGFILGQGHFIPGFEENLIGITEGKEKEFSLKFPENHLQKELVGKKVKFKVKMNSVQNVELPEITDDWAKNLGNFENLTALKANIEEGIKKEKEMEESLRIRQEILEKIAENSEFKIPESLIDLEKNRILNNLKNKVSETFKIPFEDYLNKINRTEKNLVGLFAKEAQKNAKEFLILREISKREKIEASKKEIENGINKILKNLPMEKTKELDPDKLKIYIKDEIEKEKTLKLLESLIS
jgi:trigger factor